MSSITLPRERSTKYIVADVVYDDIVPNIYTLHGYVYLSTILLILYAYKCKLFKQKRTLDKYMVKLEDLALSLEIVINK